MAVSGYIVALDQGTTSSRAVVYSLDGGEVCSASVGLGVRYPEDGWVEQDADEIWSSQLGALREAVNGIEVARIRAFGITNQRETVVCWSRKTGRGACTGYRMAVSADG